MNPVTLVITAPFYVFWIWFHFHILNDGEAFPADAMPALAIIDVLVFFVPVFELHDWFEKRKEKNGRYFFSTSK